MKGREMRSYIRGGGGRDYFINIKFLFDVDEACDQARLEMERFYELLSTIYKERCEAVFLKHFDSATVRAYTLSISLTKVEAKEVPHLFRSDRNGTVIIERTTLVNASTLRRMLGVSYDVFDKKTGKLRRIYDT